MGVLIAVFCLAGNWVVYILGLDEPSPKDPFWEAL